MAQNKKQAIRDTKIKNKSQLPQGEKTKAPASSDLFAKTDFFLDGRLNIILFITLILAFLFGLYLFDAKISEGGDDSDFIVQAKQFLEMKALPTWHGTFYPIFLSVFMWLFGFKLLLFKMLSFILIIGHFVFFFLLFRRRVSSVLLTLTLIVFTTNSHLLYFASQTYSEALYLFLQSVSMYVFILLLEDTDKNNYSLALSWKRWLLFGFLAFLISLTRHIGFSLIIATLFVLIVDKKYRAAFHALASMIVFMIPWEIYKMVVWGMIPGHSNNNRVNVVFLKDPFNPVKGTEDFHGMMVRFYENAKIYLSKQITIITNFNDPYVAKQNLTLAVIMCVLAVAVFAFALQKRNRVMIFTATYLIVSTSVTFISIQQMWGQMRLILIYVPMIFIAYGWLFDDIIKRRNKWLTAGLALFLIFASILLLIPPFMKIIIILLATGALVSSLSSESKNQPALPRTLLQTIIVLFCLIVMFQTLQLSLNKIKENKSILAENLRGNNYAGYTPDWVHFLQMSEWTSKNLSDTAVIASRKPSMSFIYGHGKTYYPLMRLPRANALNTVNYLADRYQALAFIKLKDMNEKRLPPQAMNALSSSCRAFINTAAEKSSTILDMYSVYSIDSINHEFFKILADRFELPLYTSAETFKKDFDLTNKNAYAIYPDSLMAELRHNSVDYIIDASLRVDPRSNTGNIINTVLLYSFFLDLKFPGHIQTIHQIGTNDDEPSKLYKLKY